MVIEDYMDLERELSKLQIHINRMYGRVFNEVYPFPEGGCKGR